MLDHTSFERVLGDVVAFSYGLKCTSRLPSYLAGNESRVLPIEEFHSVVAIVFSSFLQLLYFSGTGT